MILELISKLMEHDTAGDPMSGLKWTRKTTEKLSVQLKKDGVDVCPNTVGRLLKDLDFSLRVNSKKLSSGSGPERNLQFENIREHRKRAERQAIPIVSIDTKKKELVGQFKNPGAAWSRSPILVKDHDFRSEGKGMAVPYGIYDVTANRGYVCVGNSHDTPAFAVTALTRWWRDEGRVSYPNKDQLLVLADCGGSNTPTHRDWKRQLQTRLCNIYGISVTVCHYPPGASKWNPIEHRLFSEISKNWAGCPLDSYQTVINYIRTTKTKTGLMVKATLIDRVFPKGVKVPKEAMALLNLSPHSVFPKWNYTIRPQIM